MITPKKQLISDKNLFIVTATLQDAIAAPVKSPELGSAGYDAFLEKANISETDTARISPNRHTVVSSVESPSSSPIESDAGITNVPGIYLSLYTADCIPLVIYSPKKKTVALAHIGFQAIGTKLIQKVVKAMHENYEVDPADCLAYLGPSICMSEYKHRQIRGAYKKALFTRAGQTSAVHKQGVTTYISIKRAAREQLNESGVVFNNIETSDYCTVQDYELFPSHYREGLQRQHSLLTIVGIKK